MKLKQRIAIALLTVSGVILVAFVVVDNPSGVARVLTADGQVMTEGQRSWNGEKDEGQELLRAFQGVQRRVHRAPGAKTASETDDASLLRMMQQDRAFKDQRNVDLFIRAAHLLEANRSTTRRVVDVPISRRMLDKLDMYRNKVAKGGMPTLRKNRRMTVYTEPESELSSWKRFHNHISKYELYSEADPVVDDLLHDLINLPLEDMIQKSGGTQLKLIFFYGADDIDRAMFKPMRFPREQETLPDHFYFTDYERHNAEIAAFYLDRVLGFRRVPPCAGRLINVTHDIKRHADKKLLKTFFVSPAGNTCFHGDCDYYCDTSHAVCGHPEMMEGSFAAMLPSSDTILRTTWRHPWRRSYHKRNKAVWETMNSSFCDAVRLTEPYTSTTRMLYLMDMAVFDFLIGNQDRHHYETFTDFDNDTFTLHLDNGRGFGKSVFDDMSILKPVSQCCLIRLSTLTKLLRFEQDKKLSDVLLESMSRDKLHPVLTRAHLAALDRRVRIVLRTISQCIEERKNYQLVIVDDGH